MKTRKEQVRTTHADAIAISLHIQSHLSEFQNLTLPQLVEKINSTFPKSPVAESTARTIAKQLNLAMKKVKRDGTKPIPVRNSNAMRVLSRVLIRLDTRWQELTDAPLLDQNERQLLEHMRLGNFSAIPEQE